MDSHYNPAEAEPKLRNFWEEKGIYRYDPKSKKPTFSCDTPPPTVSGKMHMGHALAYSQADFIMRYKRMRGHNIFYPWGFDDNGLATERFVEKKLNIRGSAMLRSEFIKICLRETQQAEEELQQNWAALGISPDWTINYRTIEPAVIKISQRSFIELYHKGREYRKKYPTLWCPQCRTAIAQVEMEDKEQVSTLNYIKSPMQDGSFLIFATTRPELLPANVGYSIDEKGTYVKAKHDKEIWIISKQAYEKFKDEWHLQLDKEFSGKELLGKTVTTPLINRPLKITHDLSVLAEYGTGVVYFCTYGGLDCVEWMARHTDVVSINILQENGKLNEQAGTYQGLGILEARKKILEDLEHSGNLIKKETLKHAVNVHERCGTEVEYLETTQWFIKYLDLKEEFLKAGEQLNWYPHHMKNRYDNWVKGLQWDWCISRQRFFGVPIPVWYCNSCGKEHVAEEKDLPVDPTETTLHKKCSCGSTSFVGEKDVLDTWATSSLTPMIPTKWKEKNSLYEKVSPMSLRSNGHDIITFWTFNTIVKSLLHENKLPWKDIMINGWVLDPKGEKMSKSKGNIIEPSQLLEKYGADALRFWVASSKLGADNIYQEKEIISGKKTITKLWNATNFCFLNLEDYDFKKPKNLSIMDEWLLIKLNKTIEESTKGFEQYDFSVGKSKADNFFWNTFCDYYLEISKDRIYNSDRRGKESKRAAQYTLYHSLLTTLKLFAPILPHITEEIYQNHFLIKEKDTSIHLTSWPVKTPVENSHAEIIGDRFIEILFLVRQFKSQNQVSLKKEIILTLEEKDRELLSDVLDDLIAVTNAKELKYGKDIHIAL